MIWGLCSETPYSYELNFASDEGDSNPGHLDPKSEALTAGLSVGSQFRIPSVRLLILFKYNLPNYVAMILSKVVYTTFL